MDRREFNRGLGAIGAVALVPPGLQTTLHSLHDQGKGFQSMTVPLPKSVAGVRLVDSPVAKAAVELAREVSPPYLFNHAMRTYLLGALVGKAAGQRYDEELLYLACVLHDLGLTDRFAGDMPFEIEGAIAAEAFLRERGVSAERSSIVWDGIAMHPLAIAGHKRPEIALVAVGAGADVVGADMAKVTGDDRDAVLHAFPRLGFKHAFVATCADIVAHHPHGASRGFMRDIGERKVAGFHPGNICDAIAAAPFEE